MRRRTFKWKENTPGAIKDLWYWQYDHGDSFNCKVFELISKADQENRAKIAATWPDLFNAWTMWYTHPGMVRFFEQFQVFEDDKGV